jgi:ribonucleoside-diphosphate reductase alpha chain
MFITKRDGAREHYDPNKITAAMEKAFISVGQAPEGALALLLSDVEESLRGIAPVTVEAIQDAVERALMARGYYPVAKGYILYREERSKNRAAGRALASAGGAEGLDGVLARVAKDFRGEEYALGRLFSKYQSFEKGDMGAEARLAALIRAAAELTTQEAPRWEFVAGRLRAFQFHRALREETRRRNISGLYEKLRYLTDEGLYGPYILEN